MSAELSTVSGIAGRYATALFELALESKSLDAVGGELERLGRLIEETPDLKRLVRSPLVKRDDQLRAMTAVLQAAGFG